MQQPDPPAAAIVFDPQHFFYAALGLQAVIPGHKKAPVAADRQIGRKIDLFRHRRVPHQGERAPEGIPQVEHALVAADVAGEEISGVHAVRGRIVLQIAAQGQTPVGVKIEFPRQFGAGLIELRVARLQAHPPVGEIDDLTDTGVEAFFAVALIQNARGDTDRHLIGVIEAIAPGKPRVAK